MRDVLMCKLRPRLPEVSLKDALETLAIQAMCDVAAVAACPSPPVSSPPTQQLPANVLKTTPALSQNPDITHASEPGAFQKCAARIQRLDCLNAAMETCSDSSWSQSENTGMLIHRLKSNPYFSALQSSIAKSRKRWLEVNRTLLARGDNTCDIALVPCSAACSPPPHQFEGASATSNSRENVMSAFSASASPMSHGPASHSPRGGRGECSSTRSVREDTTTPAKCLIPSLSSPTLVSELSLSGKASYCSDEAAMELSKLRALEGQAQNTVHSMMTVLSEVLPICKEEVKCARTAASTAFSPAKKRFSQALGEAIQTNEIDFPEHHSAVTKYKIGKNGKKGLLPPGAIAILEDWVADHFEHPYPTDEERDFLVKGTNCTLSQINNWFSNFRSRIWRPSYESLPNDTFGSRDISTKGGR